MNGIFEVDFSKDIKIQGIPCPCASLEKKGALCFDTSIGQGGTTAWKMCGFDKSTSFCLIFDIVKKESSDHSSGQMRLRATTLSRRWVIGLGKWKQWLDKNLPLEH
uniref:Protein transport protein SEC23 n=1 Tax=Lactuca sativa TaxID=4236 RepID=A0A9R1WEI1_LACSA|nr:hypothetical protein LSAT_V11C200086670 [Lactuca sativa]